MPVPTGAPAPSLGAFALLCAAIRLRAMIAQDLMALPGQRPSCGGGASSLFLEFGTTPVRLNSKHRVRDDQPSARVRVGIPERGVDPGVVRERGISDLASRPDVEGAIGHVAGVRVRDEPGPLALPAKIPY
jgi:hypothetical protein